MRQNDQRAIIEQLLGITILTEKSNLLKDKIKETKDAITQETLKIEAIESSNEKIKASIEQLAQRQRAWSAKHKKDCEKLNTAIEELEELDIDVELTAHEKLSNWTEHNNSILALKKELGTLEPALQRADTSVEQVTLDIAGLDNAICYACNQPLNEDKKQEILATKTKELEDATAYQLEISNKCTDVVNALDEIGDINGRPKTFYDTAKEAYEHRSNVENLKHSLDRTETEDDPYQAQINDLNATAIQEINWNVVNDLVNYKDHQEFLFKLLTNKDSFIRKKIIDQNLAYLNTVSYTHPDAADE